VTRKKWEHKIRQHEEVPWKKNKYIPCSWHQTQYLKLYGNALNLSLAESLVSVLCHSLYINQTFCFHVLCSFPFNTDCAGLHCLVAAFICSRARHNPVIFLSKWKNICCLYVIDWMGKSVLLYLRHPTTLNREMEHLYAPTGCKGILLLQQTKN